MEIHRNILESLCRICGKKIVINRDYVKSKRCEYYADVLREFYGILNQEEDKEVRQDRNISNFICQHV